MGSKTTPRLTREGPRGFRGHWRRWVGRVQSSPGFRAPDTVDQHEDKDYEQEAYNCGQAHQPGFQAALCGCGEGKGSARERRGLWERREEPVGVVSVNGRISSQRTGFRKVRMRWDSGRMGTNSSQGPQRRG